jgi:hypothetical protein
MGSERGDEYKRPCSLGEGTGSKEPDYSAAPQWATASRLVPTHQQDYRAIKRRCAAMVGGFKYFGSAAITLTGIELAHRIRKRRFSFGRVAGFNYFFRQVQLSPVRAWSISELRVTKANWDRALA